MDRRKFLKTIGKVVAGCAIVPSVSEAGVMESDAKVTNEYQWHKHTDCEWHCRRRNLPMEFVTRDEYDLFTGKMI